MLEGWSGVVFHFRDTWDVSGIWGISGNVSWVPKVVTTAPCADCCSGKLLWNKEVDELKSPQESPGSIRVSVLVLFLAAVSDQRVSGGSWEVGRQGVQIPSPYLAVFPPDPAAGGFYQLCCDSAPSSPSLSYLMALIS